MKGNEANLQALFEEDSDDDDFDFNDFQGFYLEDCACNLCNEYCQYLK